MRAKAIYACDAENIGEVSFTAQDTLAGIQDSAEDGWLVGTVERTGQRGLFPAVYTELSLETGDDIAFLRKLQHDNLLSSTLKLEAFRRDLDSGRVSTSVSSANHSYSTSSSTFERTQTSYSSVSTGQQAPPVPTKPKLATRPVAAIAGPSSGSRALPPPVPSKPRMASPPAVPPKPKSVASPSASSASSQTMSPATSFSQSLGSQTTTSVRADSISASEQELARQREAEAARAWENAHLAKKPTSLDGSREVSRLFGGVDSGSSKPNYATKPAVSIPRSAACKPAVAPKPVSKPAVAPKPAVLAESSKPVSQKPQVPSKPAVLRSTAEQIDLDSERDAAASWEARHGIGKKPQGAAAVNSTRPAVMPMRKPVTCGAGSANGYKPPVVKSTAKAPAAPPLPSKSLNSSNASSWSSNQARSQQQSTHTSSSTTQHRNPATENDAPPLPHNPARAAVMSELLQARKPVPSVNPATANDAPALPYSPARAAIVKPAEKPVESVIQPAPHSLISRMNSQTTRTLSEKSSNSSIAGFSDSFDPASRQMPLTQQHQVSPATRSAINSQSSFHRSYSSVTSSEEKSISTSSGIPLTQNREVRGTLPFTSAGAYDSHPVQHYSLTSKSSSSSFSKQESFTSSSINPVSTISMFKLQEYTRIFQALDAQEGGRGYLSSEAVRNQVARSTLPDDQLRRIWQLADRNLNGKFGPGEFNIIMHLVDCAQLNYPIPNSLP
ncbi:Intersectin-2, partial [Coemansia sp. RSA 2336]